LRLKKKNKLDIKKNNKKTNLKIKNEKKKLKATNHFSESENKERLN
jgi:hypothetical protein